MKANNLLLALLASSSIILTACGGGNGTDGKTDTGSSSTSGASAATTDSASSASGTQATGSSNNTDTSSDTNSTGSSNATTPTSSSSTGSSTVTPSAPSSSGTTATPSTGTSKPTTETTTPTTGATSPTTPAVPASSTTATPSTSAIPFSGVNAHYSQGGVYKSIPIATQMATETDLGLVNIRQDTWNNTDIDNLANNVIAKAAGTKINIMPIVTAYPWNDPSLNGRQPTETSAYNYAYTMAAYAATKFKGIPVVEFGNEYDGDGHNQPVANDGVNVSDYDNNTWPIWRGSMRGAYDGWRSVDKTGQTKIINTASVGFLHLGWYKGMLNGTQPDGSTGHPKVQTDIIQLHWYSDGLDPQQTWGKDGTEYNVLKIMHDTYNKPIMFTEIGLNFDYTTAQGQQYIQKTIPELYAAKSTYGVIGFNWYELYDDVSGDYGILTNSGASKPVYTTLKATVAGLK